MTDSTAPDALRLSSLLERCGEGDLDALKEIYDSVGTLLYGFALRIVGDKAIAEEVVQDSFVRVYYRSISFDRRRASPLAWMSAIVRNRALDAARRPQFSHGSDPAARESRAAPGEPLLEAGAIVGKVHSREAGDLVAALGELGEAQQRAILTAYFDGLTHDEVATRMETDTKRIKGWIRSGLLHVKKAVAA